MRDLHAREEGFEVRSVQRYREAAALSDLNMNMNTQYIYLS